MPLHFVFNEVAFVARIVIHHELARPMSVSFDVGSSETTVKPGLFSSAVLLVKLPLAVVSGPICSDELTLAVFQITFPVSKVVAAVRIDHTAVPTLFILGPVAIVALPVWPDLLSVAVPLIATPLALVDGSVKHSHFITLKPLQIQIKQRFLARWVLICVLGQRFEGSLDMAAKVLVMAIPKIFTGYSLELKPVLGVLWDLESIEGRIGLLLMVLAKGDTSSDD